MATSTPPHNKESSYGKAGAAVPTGNKGRRACELDDAYLCWTGVSYDAPAYSLMTVIDGGRKDNFSL